MRDEKTHSQRSPLTPGFLAHAACILVLINLVGRMLKEIIAAIVVFPTLHQHLRTLHICVSQ